MKTLKGFHLNNHGCNPRKNVAITNSSLKGVNIIKNEIKFKQSLNEFNKKENFHYSFIITFGQFVFTTVAMDQTN